MFGSREEIHSTADQPAPWDGSVAGRDAPWPVAQCAAIAPLLEAFHDGGLHAEQRRWVAEHLASCATCGARLAPLAEVDQLIHSMPSPPAPPSVRDQLYARIAEAGEAGATAQPRRRFAFSLPARRTAFDSAPQAPYVAHVPAPHSLSAWLGGIAAVMVVALLAVAFAAQRQGGMASSATMRNAFLAPTPGITSCAAGSITADVPANATISDLAVVSPDDGWAVGSLLDTNTAVSASSLILHYQGCRWTPVSDAFPNVRLQSVAMVSAADGWAAGGSDSGDEQLLLHFTGGHWQRVAVPGTQAQPGIFSAVRMLSRDEGWLIFTHYGDPSGALTHTLYHYARGSWSAVAAPLAGINDVAPVGPGEAWAVGNVAADNAATDVFAHYVAGRWTTAPVPGGGRIGALRMLSARDGWAMGMFTADGTGDPPATAPLLHYNGSVWSLVNTSASAKAQYVEMLSDSDGWAVGTNVDRGSGPFLSSIVVVQHSIDGHWQTVKWPYSDLNNLSHFSRASANDYWALASYRVSVTSADGNGAYSYIKTALLHFADGSWSAYGR